MLKWDKEKLLSLFIDFNKLTDIAICLFDSNFKEVLRYPETHCDFCKLIRTNEKFKQKCMTSDIYAFKKCSETRNGFTYKCHMNLIETATPLIYNNAIIGYIMMGQIADNERDFSIISKDIKETFIDFKKAEEYYNNVLVISAEKIKAAAHILDACASYLYMSKLIAIHSEDLMARIDNYIIENIDKEISVNALCRKFHTSRVELYSIFSSLYGKSVAHYIKYVRLNYALELLKDTNLPVNKIAEKCGISDYNYFSKIFKKQYGYAASDYRKKFL
jgi:AraC-like DNA-binding protein